jgi:hypothetical protein
MLQHAVRRFATNYDASTTAWLAAVVAAGGTVSNNRSDVVNTLIAGLKTDSLFTKLDRLWMLAFADEDIWQLTYDLIGVNALTKVGPGSNLGYGGFSGNGSSSYLNSNYNPSTNGSAYTLNSASVGIGVKSNVTTARITSGFFGGFDSGNNTVSLTMFSNSSAPPTGTFDININQVLGGTRSSATLTTTAGRYIGSRTDGTSAGVKVYLNGTDVTTSGGFVSSGLPNCNMYIGASNFRDTGVSVYANDRISFVFFGGGLSSGDAAALDARLATALGAISS